MTRIKGIATAAGTLALAVGIGFVMQKSETAKRLYSGAPAEPSLDAREGVKGSGAILDVQGITLTSAELDARVAIPEAEAGVIKVSTPPVLKSPAMPEAAPRANPEKACEMTAKARPVAAAMVDLTMEAACLPGERVTIHHNGMIFTQTTSDAGKIDLTVPALAENAVYVIAFSSGEGAVAQTFVEDLKDYDRVVLQWKGTSGFQIHAREFGANYGEAGHVWQEAAGEMADAVIGKGGFMSRMGDASAPDALLAEVYTFPASANGRSGAVALSVETEVTDINCGLEIEAQTLEVLDGREMQTRNLTLAVPECDATGSFLVLNNLIQDLKVAAN